jgi:hypothetical protein
VLLSALRGDRVVYQSLLWRGAAEAHAVVSRIARNSARSYQCHKSTMGYAYAGGDSAVTATIRYMKPLITVRTLCKHLP